MEAIDNVKEVSYFSYPLLFGASFKLGANQFGTMWEDREKEHFFLVVVEKSVTRCSCAL